MEFTFYGHSCFALQVGATRFLFDPFISGNEQAGAIDIDAIQADVILVSHGHADHTADLLRVAKNTGALVISNWEIVTKIQAEGITNAHPMNFGTATFPFGTLTYMQAQHSSSFGDGTYAGNPGGFILKSDAGNFYYSGDTSLMMDMQLVPYYATIDVAILPVGGNFTMNAQDAVKAAAMIQCNNIIGVHFDTFGYIKIDHAATEKLFAVAGKKILLPEIGKTYNV